MEKVYKNSAEFTAKPMTRKAYNVFRGWDLPKDENGADKGYLVERTDKSHMSWVPEAQFNTMYAESPVDFLDRLKKEHEELNEKIVGLTKALTSDKVLEIDNYQLRLLNKQLTFMVAYEKVLTERLELLAK